MLARARAGAEAIARRLRAIEHDVVFGCCISSLLAFLDHDRPIVYYSDATARVINTTYPVYAARPHAYHEACDEFERRALARASRCAFASREVLRSAIDDYALPPERGSVIPLGANVVPENPRATVIPAPPPTREDFRLCMVAADPVRKRLDLAVSIVEELVRRGWRARLSVIGPLTPCASRSGVVDHLGRLRLGVASDLERHRRVLERSHLLLLPSLGEAFGIAPCEAAHFGRPSLVSDAGGLPSAVLDGVTGMVLPVNAPAGAYADAAEGLAASPARYASMSLAAAERARRELTWEAWAGSVRGLLESVPTATIAPCTRPGLAQRPAS